MDANFFRNKRITVFGLGLNGGGVGAVKYLVEHGAKVIVTDIKTKEELASSISKLKGLKNVTYVLGQNRPEDFTKVDMVVKNPGVSWKNAHIKLALENKVPVEMDSSLFFKLCKNPIIGITGSKGKTTTAMMVFEIMRSAGLSPLRAGVGQISVLDRLALAKKNSVIIFELSSRRLSALKKDNLSSKIAVITNILSEFPKWYASLDDFINEERNIYLFQKPTDWLVFNKDSQILEEISQEAKSQAIKFSTSKLENNHSVFVDENSIYLNTGNDAKKIASLDEIKVNGEEGVSNLMAAIGAVYALGIDAKEIRKAVLKLKITE